jgi:hypothetical protein
MPRACRTCRSRSRPLRVQRGQPLGVERVDHVPDRVLIRGDQPRDRRHHGARRRPANVYGQRASHGGGTASDQGGRLATAAGRLASARYAHLVVLEVIRHLPAAPPGQGVAGWPGLPGDGGDGPGEPALFGGAGYHWPFG